MKTKSITKSKNTHDPELLIEFSTINALELSGDLGYLYKSEMISQSGRELLKQLDEHIKTVAEG